ncbi:hypothetical protein [Yoonia sp. R2-816]|uniref:hypothetical protein n=1 Tax=Yoonia sp. R2-816 TaxID=3342638 RepID=UPI00372BEA9F
MIDGTMHRGARLVTFLLGLSGAILMAGFLYVITYQPQLIEAKAQSFVISTVEERVKLALDAAQTAAEESDNSLLQSLAGRFADNAEVLAEQRDAAIAALVRNTAANRCAGDCDAATIRGTIASQALQSRIAQFKIGERTVGEFVVQRYEDTLNGLKKDLQTFSLANLIAFLTLMFMAVFRGRLGARILPMAILLAAYVIYACYWYVFAQDWASAIMFNDWVAGLYVLTMFFVYVVLIDWTFLRGRLTVAFIRSLPEAFGAMLSGLMIDLSI